MALTCQTSPLSLHRETLPSSIVRPLTRYVKRSRIPHQTVVAAVRQTTRKQQLLSSSAESPSNSNISTEPLKDIEGGSELDGANAISSVSSATSSDAASSEAGTEGAPKTWVATLSVFGGLAALALGGYIFKDQIKAFLDFFINAVDEWGPLGYLAYAAVYTGLEVLAVPAIPLTMTAGVIFGPVTGTLIVSVSATAAATIAFLIARYAARDKVLSIAAKNPKWAAIDKAIGRDGFKFVTLLRLSPLLPLAASNYLYGLTSVELGPYVLGSWLGMLPGTWAYVGAGHVGKAVLTEGAEGSLGFESWQLAAGLGLTALAMGFVGRLAKQALDEVEKEEAEAKSKEGSSAGSSEASS